ncbi:GNAT family protein [Virgibacillus sp. LDC-1]|uniref:GNAT family N-acetyltransferase n=1 Tax=Virgibacillus sp. LDC-1 TaxID=3039856 RepID=UPI0024DEF1DF|nr:GNAT family protein [Virgibacillus sp. LDC-1]
MITQFFTERLHVRKITTKDSEELFRIWSDPDVTRFMNISNFTNEQQAADMIYFLNQLYEKNEAVRYSIIELSTNKIIGSCGFNSLDKEHDRTEIGYELAKASWGKGYATEAISKLIDIAFQEMNLNRIEAKIDAKNKNSIRLMERLHFTYEGTLRQYEKNDGKYADIQLFSRLKSD